MVERIMDYIIKKYVFLTSTHLLFIPSWFQFSPSMEKECCFISEVSARDTMLRFNANQKSYHYNSPNYSLEGRYHLLSTYYAPGVDSNRCCCPLLMPALGHTSCQALCTDSELFQEPLHPPPTCQIDEVQRGEETPQSGSSTHMKCSGAPRSYFPPVLSLLGPRP